MGKMANISATFGIIMGKYAIILHNMKEHMELGWKLLFIWILLVCFGWFFFRPSFLAFILLAFFFHLLLLFLPIFCFPYLSVLSLSCFIFPYRNRMEVINYKNGCELIRTLVPLLLIVVICSTKISHSKRDVIVLLRTIISP